MDPARREQILRAYVRRSRSFHEIASRRSDRGLTFPLEAPGADPEPEAAPPPAHVERPLSSREVDVLSLVAQGCSNREIGTKLGVSVETVKTHVQHVLHALGARNRAHAVSLGCELGLLANGRSAAGGQVAVWAGTTGAGAP